MEQFKQWWQSITQREQQLTILSAVMLVIAAIYWGVWAPQYEQLAENKKQLARAESMLSWTKEKSTLILQSGNVTTQVKSGNLMQILNSSVRQHNITFSRTVNRGGNVEVWITDVEFDAFVSWLTKLSNEYGITVLNADLAKSNREGYIKVNRLLLGK
jgi:general secretion pathway protein M